MKEIGALWVKEYEKDGRKQKMLSGRLDLGVFGEVDVVIFPNSGKKEEKHPDYKIYLSKKEDKSETEVEPF